jgi:acyl-CoA reductase-like NAD-dependent aldehyde dehydrogenase
MMDQNFQALCERDHHYIDGQWVKGTGEHLTLIDPYTEQPFGRAPAGDATLVDQAVTAAQRAQASWSSTSVNERAAWLGRWLQELHPQAETIAQLISREMGAPIARGRMSQAAGGLLALQAFAKMASHVQHVERIANSVVVREAAGVAGLITAWNYPFFLAIGKAAPALLAGCPVVLKPSDFTPLSLYLMADAAHRISLPAGVFNLVHGTGPVVGEAISGHSGIDVVSYTGSIPIGKRVMERAAINVKRVSLELGGKSAAIVLPGADLRVTGRRPWGPLPPTAISSRCCPTSAAGLNKAHSWCAVVKVLCKACAVDGSFSPRYLRRSTPACGLHRKKFLALC